MADDWPEGRGHCSALSNSNSRGKLIIHVPQGINEGNLCCYSSMNASSEPWSEGYLGSAYTIQFWALENSSFLADCLQKWLWSLPPVVWMCFWRADMEYLFGQSLAVLIVFSLDSTAFLGRITIGHLIRPWMLKCGCLDFYFPSLLGQFSLVEKEDNINCSWIPSSPVPFSCTLLNCCSCLQNHVHLLSPGIASRKWVMAPGTPKAT